MAINFLFVVSRGDGKILETRRANGAAIVADIFELIIFLGEHDLFDRVKLVLAGGSKQFGCGEIGAKWVWDLLQKEPATPLNTRKLKITEIKAP